MKKIKDEFILVVEPIIEKFSQAKKEIIKSQSYEQAEVLREDAKNMIQYLADKFNIKVEFKS